MPLPSFVFPIGFSLYLAGLTAVVSSVLGGMIYAFFDLSPKPTSAITLGVVGAVTAAVLLFIAWLAD